MPEHDRPSYDAPAHSRSAAGPSWPEQYRPVDVVDPYPGPHGWAPVPPPAATRRTFGAKVTAAIAAGAFLVGAAAAILVGGLTGPVAGPGGPPPGLSSSQDGGSGAGTTPGAGSGATGQGTGTGT
jgi:hypothetical protein